MADSKDNGAERANAALRHAAPDLLAALVSIANNLTELGVKGRLRNAELVIVAHLLGEARAAIAKTEAR